jgi:hypothetical protein
MEATYKNENDKCILSGKTFNEMKRRFDIYPDMLEAIKSTQIALQALSDGKRDGGTMGQCSLANDLLKLIIKRAGE